MVSKMNKSDSVSGTLSYLNDMSNKKAQRDASKLNESTQPKQRRAPNVVPPKGSVKVKKVQAPKNNFVAVAEPHLKNFANMLSEELSNVKKIREEELEKIRQEELAKIRFEEAEKIRLEEEAKIHQEKERERIRAELAEQAFMEKEREKIRAELLKEYNQVKTQENYVDLSNHNAENIEVVQVEESVEYEELEEEYHEEKTENQIDESLLIFSNNKNNHQSNQVNEQTDFVTFDDLKKHYSDFINKINHQLSTVGGGGEVLLKKLDDIDMTTVQNGDFISFDATTGKFVGGSIPTAGEEGGVLEGGSY